MLRDTAFCYLLLALRAAILSRIAAREDADEVDDDEDVAGREDCDAEMGKEEDLFVTPGPAAVLVAVC